jgi:hypothetical protein
MSLIRLLLLLIIGASQIQAENPCDCSSHVMKIAKRTTFCGRDIQYTNKSLNKNCSPDDIYYCQVSGEKVFKSSLALNCTEEKLVCLQSSTSCEHPKAAVCFMHTCDSKYFYNLKLFGLKK